MPLKNCSRALLLYFAMVTPLYAGSLQGSTLGIIEQVEKNLLYSKEILKPNPSEPLKIEHGAWSQEESESLAEKATTDIASEIKRNVKTENEVILRRRAFEAMTMGEHEVSVEYYKRILRQNKDNAYAKLGLAYAYQQLGQYRQAKPLFLDVLRTFPGDEKIIVNLLSIVTEETPYEATYLLSALADKNPDSSLIQAQTSVAYANVGKYDEALEYLGRASAREPYNLQYRYNTAVIYDMKGDYARAASMYGDVLAYARNGNMSSQIPQRDIEQRIRVINEHIR